MNGRLGERTPIAVVLVVVVLAAGAAGWFGPSARETAGWLELNRG